MSFDRVRQPLRMSEAIARQIEEQIHQGRLQPEEMLPSENELMRQFGVGRNTVREALRMLEASGLVKIRQGARGGSFISRMTNEFVSDFLVKAFRLGKVPPEAFHTFRLAVEPAIAEIVAAKTDIDAGIVLQMEGNIAKATSLFKSGESTACANMDFHVLLAEATGNMMFIVVLRTLRAGFDTVTPQDKERFRPESIEYHQKILEAVKNRDPAEARELMYRHLIQIGEVAKTDDFTIGEGR
jgi:GntR family transcriptional regulator, transcriptional repressor for pyruvate dehydrogenase complex